MHPLNTGRWLGAAAAGIAASAILASSASAAFTGDYVDPLTGSAIEGRGATFATNLYRPSGLIADFTTSVGGPGVAYNDNNSAPAAEGGFIAGSPSTNAENGSGAGRRTLGATGTPSSPNPWAALGTYNRYGNRHSVIRFAGSDEPPTASQETDMENGPQTVIDSASGPQVTNQDDGELRTIPLTSGAVAVMVNFPDSCSIPAGLQYRPAADGTTRFAVDKYTWEQAWSGEISTWGELLGTSCSTPIKRAVRLDSSGTTFAFKQWLNAINPDTAWNTLYVDPNNTVWPRNSGGTAVIRPTATGGGALASLVSTTDGAIGYADLATARSAGFQKTNAADDTYWVPMQNGLDEYTDPQEFVNGYRNGDTTRRGANCANATYTNLPSGADPSLGTSGTNGRWFNVEGVDSPRGYGICTLTYALVWDDYCDVYGASDIEQGKARSVADFFQYAVTDSTAISIAKQKDYSPLAPAIKAISTQGVNAIGWRKAGVTNNPSCNP